MADSGVNMPIVVAFKLTRRDVVESFRWLVFRQTGVRFIYLLWCVGALFFIVLTLASPGVSVMRAFKVLLWGALLVGSFPGLAYAGGHWRWSTSSFQRTSSIVAAAR
jgi:hypothetical protein